MEPTEPIGTEGQDLMTSRTRRVLAPILASTALLAAAACSPGSDASDADPQPVEQSSSSASQTPTESPTESPTGSTPPPEATSSSPTDPAAEDPAPATLADRLLAAPDLPGFNQEFTWREVRTTRREPDTLSGRCHQFDLASIGATKVAFRTYEPADSVKGDHASHLVAEFPDAETAQRAYAVLEAWRRDCKAQLRDYERRQVGAMQPVNGAGDRSGWYLLSYGPVGDDPDEGMFDATGVVLSGNRVAVLRLALVGQDYNYEQGQEPMVAAVQAAAPLLAG
jgi:hypothetical protein